MQRVLSVSRRTDIPAFYLDWFQRGMDRGRFDVRNPRSGRVSRVPVSPETVHSFVFWSKNFGPFLTRTIGERLRDAGYGLFFQFTVNSADSLLEPCVPPLEDRLAQLHTLSERFGADRVIWRFDPVCRYQDPRGRMRNNLSDFPLIAREASQAGIHRCITSFADPYRKVSKRFADKHLVLIDPSPDWKSSVIRRMVHVLSPFEIDLALCCEPDVCKAAEKTLPVSAAACVDGTLLKQLKPGRVSAAKDTGQRRSQGCGCTRSTDIGSYAGHPCYHHCLYCYAAPAKTAGKQVLL
ncbi:MAG: DNA photolyase [Deltaproteobacteria bacterium]|nr:MAG: DNA photolyase [Deltaproteobacteria bacterium]